MGRKVAVVGGGISGLCAAFRLKRAGVDGTVFERGDSVGGNIKTMQTDGFLYEIGPNSTLASVELLQLLNDLGITDQIAPPSPAAKKRFIVKGGKIVALPSGLLDMLKGGVFSAKGRLRLLKELFVVSKSPSDESVAAFFERRLGKEIVDYAIDPFISGVYAGDPDRLSIRSAFSRLYEMERDYGSLLNAGLFGKKDKAKMIPKGTPRSITFRAGMQTLSDALYEELKDNIRLNTRVESIEMVGSEGFKIRAGRGEDIFDAVVVATPAHAAARLIEGMDAADLSSELSGIYYPPVSIVYTGFSKDQVKADVAGFGFLVPGREKRNILGSLWTSSVFENRVPDGYHLFTTFVGGSRRSELCDNDDGELLKIVLDELGSILGIEGEPVFTAVKKWKKAIPQYNIGYESVLVAIENFRKNYPGLFFCSNYYKGISVSDCIKNGAATANEITDLFSSREKSK